jgi:hypothetical protein
MYPTLSMITPVSKEDFEIITLQQMMAGKF